MKSLRLLFVAIPKTTWKKWPKTRTFEELAADARVCERRILQNINIGRERDRYFRICRTLENAAREAVTCGLGVLLEPPSGSSQKLLHTPDRYLQLVEVLEIVVSHEGVISSISKKISDVTSVKKRSYWVRFCALFYEWIRILQSWLPSKPKVSEILKNRKIPKIDRTSPLGHVVTDSNHCFHSPGEEIELQGIIFKTLNIGLLRNILGYDDQTASFIIAMAQEVRKKFDRAKELESGIVKILMFEPSKT